MLLNMPVMWELTDKTNWQLVLAMRSLYIHQSESQEVYVLSIFYC